MRRIVFLQIGFVNLHWERINPNFEDVPRHNNVVMGSGDFFHKEWLIVEQKQLSTEECSRYCIMVMCVLASVTVSGVPFISTYVF